MCLDFNWLAHQNGNSYTMYGMNSMEYITFLWGFIYSFCI